MNPAIHQPVADINHLVDATDRPLPGGDQLAVGRALRCQRALQGEWRRAAGDGWV